MLWQYSRKESKMLLLATLLVFSAYGFLLSQNWRDVAPPVAPQGANTVGVYVGVPENEVNTLVAQLDRRAAELDAREQALVDARAQAQTDVSTLFWITIIGIGLLGLILMNFYLDNRRRHSLAG